MVFVMIISYIIIQIFSFLFDDFNAHIFGRDGQEINRQDLLIFHYVCYEKEISGKTL